MIRTLKSNKFIVLLLVIVCFLFMINPSIYAKSCLNAVSIWGLKVFPLLFPFFIFTRLIVNLSTIKPNIMDKFFKKAYHTPNGSFFVFFLSILSGYPMGAKLISTMFENGNITTDEAKKMLSFCSVSGPMFMIGTVGISILFSYKAGLIILICNLLACLINGLIFRGKTSTSKPKYSAKKKENILSDSVYDSLISILMVGSYIILSFLIIDLLNEIKFLPVFSTTICSVFHCQEKLNVVKGCLSGIIEITRGIVDIGQTNIPISVKAIISSGLIGFGGISVMFQSLSFLSKLNISPKFMFLQKLCQGLICTLISIPICILFL